jgi:hypothetical protein
MNDRFMKMWPFLVEWEGSVYENDPDDPGGATKFGIDKRSHPQEDIKNLTAERAQEIYWDSYWQKYHCGGYLYPFGEVIFNCCVNCGYGRVKKILATGADTASKFMDEQENFYKRLADARPASKKYLKGWLNRTRALRKFLNITGLLLAFALVSCAEQPRPIQTLRWSTDGYEPGAAYKPTPTPPGLLVQR